MYQLPLLQKESSCNWDRFNWQTGILGHRAVSVTLGGSIMLPQPPPPVASELALSRPKLMDRRTTRMTDEPAGNFDHNPTIRPARRLQPGKRSTIGSDIVHGNRELMTPTKIDPPAFRRF